MQSERMYQAVSGQGGVTKLVILPHESHGYREPTSNSDQTLVNLPLRKAS